MFTKRTRKRLMITIAYLSSFIINLILFYPLLKIVFR